MFKLMIGTFLIYSGIVCIGTGAASLFISRRKNTKRKRPSFEEEFQATISSENQNKLQVIIDMAVADGVLTKKEEEKVLVEAQKLGIDAEEAKSVLYRCLEETGDFAETRIIDIQKEKGNQFEAYVAKKFDKRFFVLTDWAGDKYDNGLYAESTLHPDLKFSYKAGNVKQDLAIECKYRSMFVNDEITWAKESQLKNYRKFQKDAGVPVFVAIGISGEATNPEELFIVPLDKIESNILSKSTLQTFKKHNFKEKNFYFNPQTLQLS